jgi:hypothetical protein
MSQQSLTVQQYELKITELQRQMQELRDENQRLRSLLSLSSKYQKQHDGDDEVNPLLLGSQSTTFSQHHQRSQIRQNNGEQQQQQQQQQQNGTVTKSNHHARPQQQQKQPRPQSPSNPPPATTSTTATSPRATRLRAINSPVSLPGHSDLSSPSSDLESGDDQQPRQQNHYTTSTPVSSRKQSRASGHQQLQWNSSTGQLPTPPIQPRMSSHSRKLSVGSDNEEDNDNSNDDGGSNSSVVRGTPTKSSPRTFTRTASSMLPNDDQAEQEVRSSTVQSNGSGSGSGSLRRSLSQHRPTTTAMIVNGNVTTLPASPQPPYQQQQQQQQPSQQISNGRRH